MLLSYTAARQKVIEVALAQRYRPISEVIDLSTGACGRVLSNPIVADRDYPPFDRSTRDGFAVRAADLAASGITLHRIGEVKAGDNFERRLAAGECVQIMTGAPVPAGADAVVMIEFTAVAGDRVMFQREAAVGQNIVHQGSEGRSGQQLLPAGTRLGYAEMAVAAQVGAYRVDVFAMPRVAILSTGDEVVDMTAAPGPFQIRNGNGLSIETLVMLSGGRPEQLGNAPDEKVALRRFIERGLNADILVLSGGVSMGKYDLVEEVLAELGAEIFFDGVSIRPGRPAVFGRCRGKLVFGLPGNPVSTMVTFELFVLPALDVLSGAPARPLPLVGARLNHAVHEKEGMAHFLPALLEQSNGEPHISALSWKGSGDIVTIAHANAFLVVPADRPDWAAGEWAPVLFRRGPEGASR
jgi:molybdopterin molybdotransferase